MTQRLFSYILPVDDGAAPNPFRGLCTLAICKPRIRSVASPGDWIAGVGSRNAPSGDLSGHLVYAMKVEEAIPMADYDRRAPNEWPNRLPNHRSPDLSERLGDCIYDFSSNPPRQRPGVHGPANKSTDLSGNKVLVSRNFYYFGSRAIQLPDHLLAICPSTQGHRSHKNAQYVRPFEEWLLSLNLAPGQLYGWPDYIIDWSSTTKHGGCIERSNDSDDEENN